MVGKQLGITPCVHVTTLSNRPVDLSIWWTASVLKLKASKDVDYLQILLLSGGLDFGRKDYGFLAKEATTCSGRRKSIRMDAVASRYVSGVLPWSHRLRRKGWITVHSYLRYFASRLRICVSPCRAMISLTEGRASSTFWIPPCALIFANTSRIAPTAAFIAWFP